MHRWKVNMDDEDEEIQEMLLVGKSLLIVSKAEVFVPLTLLFSSTV